MRFAYTLLEIFLSIHRNKQKKTKNERNKNYFQFAQLENECDHFSMNEIGKPAQIFFFLSLCF